MALEQFAPCAKTLDLKTQKNKTPVSKILFIKFPSRAID
jgi:hypothetical protein